MTRKKSKNLQLLLTQSYINSPTSTHIVAQLKQAKDLLCYLPKMILTMFCYCISWYFPHLAYGKVATLLVVIFSNAVWLKIHINWTVGVISVSLIRSTVDSMELCENVNQQFELRVQKEMPMCWIGQVAVFSLWPNVSIVSC